MQIRDEQMEDIRRAAELALESEIMGLLREDYPDVVGPLSPEAFRLMVRHGMARARGYELTWRSSLYSFVSLMFFVAPNFDEHPAIRERLANPVAPPDYVMKSTVEKTTAE